jgi:hypothetical protein
MTRSRPVEFTVPHSGLGGCRHFSEWKALSAFDKPSWEEQAVQASIAEQKSKRPPPLSADAARARQLPAVHASKEDTQSLPVRRLDLSSLTKPWRQGMGSQAMPKTLQAPDEDPGQRCNRVPTEEVSIRKAVFEQSSCPVHVLL